MGNNIATSIHNQKQGNQLFTNKNYNNRKYFAICPHIRDNGRKSAIYVIGLNSKEKSELRVILAIKSAIKEVSPLYGSAEKFYKQEPFITRFRIPKDLTGNFMASLTSKLLWSRLIHNIMLSGYWPLTTLKPQRFISKSVFMFIQQPKNSPDFLVNKPEALCCISLNLYNKLQLVIQDCYSQEIIDSLAELLDTTWKNRCPEEILAEKLKQDMDPNYVAAKNGENSSSGNNLYNFTVEKRAHSYENLAVYEIDLRYDLWNKPGPFKLIKSRYFLSKMCTHLGGNHGWQFLITGNIKGNCDYFWFFKAFSGGGKFPAIVRTNDKNFNYERSQSNRQLPKSTSPTRRRISLAEKTNLAYVTWSPKINYTIEPGAVILGNDDSIYFSGFDQRVLREVESCLGTNEVFKGFPIDRKNRSDYFSINNGLEIKLNGDHMKHSVRK